MDFTAQLLEAFKKTGTEKVFDKGEFIIREGEVEKNLYFIEEGAVRVFYLTEFEEHVIRLGYKSSLINSLASYIKGTPSEFYIEALRKTSVRILPKKNIVELVESDPGLLKGYTQLLEHLIAQQIEREIDLLITVPAERLNRVLTRSPHLFQEIPLKYIASYLRMTPETLSRLRKS